MNLDTRTAEPGSAPADVAPRGRSHRSAVTGAAVVATAVCATAVALALVPASAAGPDPAVAGDPITGDNVADVLEMIRVADAVDAAVDAKAWPTARALFTDTIDVDFTSLAGGEPATIPSDALIEGWSANLAAEKTSFHQRTNHRVRFDGPDAATMTSEGYAWNRMEAGADEANGGDPMWEVWGTYTHGFERVDGAWRVASMALDVAAQRGNGWVRDTVPGS